MVRRSRNVVSFDPVKDNSSLLRGVLTGVLRVAKEGLFSGLDNLQVSSVMERRHATAFGVVLEFKRVREDETPDHALEAALARIRGRDYAAELRARGADPVRAYAVVFDGMRVRVRAGEA